MPALKLLQKGLLPYRTAWALQQQLHEQRRNSAIPDTLILLEHPPVYTFGKNADHENLLNARDAEVVQSDRGGDITWHGPGQLVGYPILNLKDHRQSVSWYMRQLEEVIIRVLQHFNIPAGRIDKLTGVWVADRKICAMGVRLSRWVTMHGFALNVGPDMSYFDGMIPCGIKGKGVVSMNEILEEQLTINDVIPILTSSFQRVFEFDDVIGL